MHVLLFLVISVLINNTVLSQDTVNKNSTNILSLLTSKTNIGKDKFLFADNYIGNVRSPITVIEYASFSCTHCASFSQEILPLIKEKYIDTGKVLFIYRDFPLDKPSLYASVLSHCYASGKYCQEDCAEDNKNCCLEEREYFNMYNAIFRSRPEWVNSEVDGLLSIAKVGKMGEQEYYACIKDIEIRDRVMNSKYVAYQNLGVDSAPVFFINGRKYEGMQNFQFFADIFDEIIRVSDKNK